MDFKTVLDFFQGSIFSDEYFGDFAKIRQDLQNLEARSMEASNSYANPEHRAWIKLLQSIFAMLKGNLAMALDSVQEISRIEDLPPKWLFRCSAYEALYVSLRRYPAIIRFKPELGGPTAALRSSEIGYNEIINKYQRDIRTSLTSDSPSVRIEYQVFQFLSFASLPLWNNAFIQHPSYAKGPWESFKRSAGQHLARRIGNSTLLRSAAVNVGIHQLDHYLARLELELRYGQSPKKSQMADDLQTRYDTLGDKHNLAITKMLEADYILAPPFTNPIALNLILTESFQPGFSIGSWDSVESNLKLGNTVAASRLYQEAHDLFSLIGSPRGLAAVLLRQGCVEHIQASIGNVSFEEKSTRCDIARQKFSQALRLFDLDEAHCQIVRGHQILLKITSGVDNSIAREASEIGRWGRSSKNELISSFVGNLMLRFGRRQMLDYARYGSALKCYKCAQACFSGVRDQFGYFRAANAEMHILNLMNDSLAARSMVDSQKELFKGLLQYIDKVVDDRASAASAVTAMKQDMISMFGSLVNEVYHSAGDVEALRLWNGELRLLRKGKDSATISMALSDINMSKYIFGDKSSSKGVTSILTGLSHFLLGERKPSQAQSSILDYVQRGQDLIEKFHEANSEWNDALQRLDIDIAEGCLRNYIQKAAPCNIVAYSQDIFPVFAAATLGDFEAAQMMLEDVLDRNYIDYDVIHHPAAEEAWLQTANKNLQGTIGLDNAVAACALAHDWELGQRILQRTERVFPKYFSSETTDPSVELWKRLAWVGVIYEYNNAPLKAFATFLQASHLAEQNRNFTYDSNQRRGIFSSAPFGEVYTGLARLCLRAGELGVPMAVLNVYPHKHPQVKSWKEHTLLFIEQGKARSLLEALTSQPLDSTASDARTSRHHKRRVRMALLSLETRNPLQEAELAVLNEELREFEYELNPSTAFMSAIGLAINLEDIYRVISDDEVVIEVDFSSHGFTLLGITSIGIEYAQHRPKLGLEIRKPVLRALKHLSDYGDKDAVTSKSKAELEVSLREISDELILPLVHLIRKKNHVIFITSRPLTAFPFSALLLDGEPLFFRVAVSQAPSLSTLLHLSKRGEISTDLIEATHPPVSICAVAKATRIGRAAKGVSQEIPLQMAAIESMIISRTFGTWPVEGNTIDRKVFHSLIEEGDKHGMSSSDAHNRILHVGTHGEYYPNSPWLSFISLKEKIRILDMAQSRLKSARKTALIVFATCLSGMGQGTLGNDILSFAHTVLEMNCSAYLGALWKVDDQATMLLMTIFYRLLRDNVTGASKTPVKIAKVWQEAQKTLYNLDFDGVQDLINDLVQVLEKAESEGYDLEGFVKNWKTKLRDVAQALKERNVDFKHPFYWGPFVMVGYGGLEF